MVEVVGCVPDLHAVLKDNLNWVRDLLNSMKEEIREQASVLYGVVANEAFDDKSFETAINYLINQTGSKSLEAQHGAILGIGNCMERRIYSRRKSAKEVENWELLKTSFGAISK